VVDHIIFVLMLL